jgi:four helix bundle protein
VEKEFIKNLENRLIEFAVNIIKLVEALPESYAGKAIANQLVRSGTSPALNYGEAQSAESRKDFLHKVKIVLKELRETLVTLKIIKLSGIYKGKTNIDEMIKENDELIAIFVTSVNTALKNLNKTNQKP